MILGCYLMHLNFIIQNFFKGKYRMESKGVKRMLTVEDVDECDLGTYTCETTDQRSSYTYNMSKCSDDICLLKCLEDVFACKDEEVTFGTEVANEKVRSLRSSFFAIFIEKNL